MPQSHSTSFRGRGADCHTDAAVTGGAHARLGARGVNVPNSAGPRGRDGGAEMVHIVDDLHLGLVYVPLARSLRLDKHRQVKAPPHQMGV